MPSTELNLHWQRHSSRMSYIRGYTERLFSLFFFRTEYVNNRRTVSVIQKAKETNYTENKMRCIVEKCGKDDSSMENGRRARTVYTRNQVKELEKIFQINHYVDLESRKSLSKRIGLDEDRIQVIR